MEPLPTLDGGDNGHARICGVWRRLWAGAIDALILGVIGGTAGWLWFDPMVGLGSFGRPIGAALAITYLGVLNSAAVGQTIGKRIARIRVVNHQGDAIALGRSLVRSLILVAALALNGLVVSAQGFLAQAQYFVSLAAFALAGLIVYLFLFNRRTRQSVHDLIVRSYVVHHGAPGTVRAVPVWLGHIVPALVWVVLVAASPVVMSHLIDSSSVEALRPVQQRLQAALDTPRVSVMLGESHFQEIGTASPTITDYVRVTALLNRKPESVEAVANSIAGIVLREYPEAQQKARLIVSVGYGFDILVTSWSISQGYSYTPAEWEQRVAIDSAT